MKNSATTVFFDFDGTLTTRDSLLPFLRFVCGPIGLGLGMIASLPQLAGYMSGLLPNDRAKQHLLSSTLRRRSREELMSAGKDFANTVLPPMLRASTIKRLHRYQDMGAKCVLISASLDIYLNYWARKTGFTDVLCSNLEFDAAGLATGRLLGTNCYGEEKVRRARHYLKIHGRELSSTVAYGDTSGDIPLLKFVSEGYIIKNASIYKFH